LTNDAIEDDAEDPKEASHLDYKYLKSYEGPLSKQLPKRRTGKGDTEELIKKKKMPIPLISFERKKFGGIRMCQRCLRTKVNFLWLIISIAR